LHKGEIFPVPMLGSVTLGAPIKLAADDTKETFLAKTRAALAALGDNSASGSTNR
jgi:hypothetical protein